MSLFNTSLRGEDQEKDYCDRKQLTMTTLRMTSEARNQLKDILINEVTIRSRSGVISVRYHVQPSALGSVYMQTD